MLSGNQIYSNSTNQQNIKIKKLVFINRLYFTQRTYKDKLMYTKKTNPTNSRNKNQQAPFLIEDDSNDSSKPYCYACTKYEQDINILQQKLMQTHNKLIQQIDICLWHQMKIIKLTTNSRVRDVQNNNILNRQQSGKIHKKNEQDYNHSIEPLLQAKTQLLRNDLQAMRAKVLSQISKSNRLKQENRELQMKHQKEIQQFRDKIRKIQANRNNIVDENQQLQIQIQNLKKANTKISTKCVCGFEQKYYDLDKAFMNQRTVTNQLIQQNNKLQNKIQDLYEEKAKSPVYDNPVKYNREQINTQPKKKKSQNRQKLKQQFQATKNLIKKLQEAELQIRNKSSKI